jgi:hypothetical protein
VSSSLPENIDRIAGNWNSFAAATLPLMTQSIGLYGLPAAHAYGHFEALWLEKLFACLEAV